MPDQTNPLAWRQHPRSIATQSSQASLQPAPSARPRCANASCRRSWLGFLKDHRRPIFEDRWACSAHCLRALVDIAIRRESPTAHISEFEHSHRIPLGLILLTRGWITQFQLQHALAMQRQTGGLLGRWLIEECGISEERILHALAVQWRCNVFSLHNFHPQQMAFAAPREVIERIALLPLRVSSHGPLRLAFADRPNPAAAFALQRMTGLEVQSGLLSHTDWKMAHRALLQCRPIRCSLEHLSNRETLSRRIASDLTGMAPRASRLVRIQDLFWLRMWLEGPAVDAPHGAIPSSPEDVLDRIYTIGTSQAA
jgi:hypothetical protein